MTKKPTSKATMKSTARKRTSKKAVTQGRPPGLCRRVNLFLFKLSLALFIVVACWGIYLDSKIQTRFNGDMWQLPAAVYSRELQLYTQLRLTRSEVQRELELLNYRKVQHAVQPGDYAASDTRIELVRRGFNFADGSEAPLPLLLTFSKTRLTKIQQRDTGVALDSVRLDPILLDRIHLGQTDDRLFVSYEDIPSNLIQALLQTEDRHFFEHDGVSLIAIARAFFVNMQAGRTVQGGSTITQQLAKNLFLSRERKLWRKITEAYMAILIDLRYDKTDILEAYLNEVYLGQNGQYAVHGVGLASYFYFGRPVNSLSEDEQALLIALVKGPSYYDPWRHPERATERRDVVLRLLASADYLSSERYKEMVNRPLDLVERGSMGYQRVPEFTQLVRRELEERIMPNWKEANGLTIFTTLKPIAQRQARDATDKQLKALATTDQRKELQAAVVVTQRDSGAVLALISGKDEGYAGFNRALDARRSIGSLVKPFVYLTAYQQGYSPGQMIEDTPYALSVNGKRWEPKNYDKQYRGQVMLYQALAKSLNIPTVRLGMDIGVDNVINTLQKAGLKQTVQPYPSVLLGSLSMAPIDVAQIYQTLASEGHYQPLHGIEALVDQHGRTIYQYHSSSEQRWSRLSSYQILFNMMKVTREGTAQSLRWRVPKVDLAGKTGTTDDLRDAWYVGIDERQVITVWVGRDDNKPAGVTGSSGALPLYANYMKQSAPQSLHLASPDDLTWLHFSTHSGNAVAAGCPDTELLPAPKTMANNIQGCFAEKVRSLFGHSK